MDFIKSNLSSLGAIMAVYGLASAVLSFFDYNIKFLLWVDIWGTTIGWLIRAGLMISGIALFFLFANPEEEE